MTRDTRADEAMTEADAIRYLETHTDLLLHHPQLLVKLEIAHGRKGAASLVERQLAILREQVAQERQRMVCLIDHAREYESLSKHLHELTTKLILARSFKHVRDILEVELKIEFEARAVTLLQFSLPDAGPDAGPHIAATAPAPEALGQLMELDGCQCGPLTEEQFTELFGIQAGQLRSAALVPLKGPKIRGLLAIASCDPDRFTADMGTDVLERLADIISAKLIELAFLHHD